MFQKSVADTCKKTVTGVSWDFLKDFVGYRATNTAQVKYIEDKIKSKKSNFYQEDK